MFTGRFKTPVQGAVLCALLLCSLDDKRLPAHMHRTLPALCNSCRNRVEWLVVRARTRQFTRCIAHAVSACSRRCSFVKQDEEKWATTSGSNLGLNCIPVWQVQPQLRISTSFALPCFTCIGLLNLRRNTQSTMRGQKTIKTEGKV